MSALAHNARPVGDDLRPGGAVGVVADLGGVACPRFDGDPETLLDQLLDDLGHGGDPPFAREGLSRDSDQQ